MDRCERFDQPVHTTKKKEFLPRLNNIHRRRWRTRTTHTTDWQGIFFLWTAKPQRVKVGMINNMLPRKNNQQNG